MFFKDGEREKIFYSILLKIIARNKLNIEFPIKHIIPLVEDNMNYIKNSILGTIRQRTFDLIKRVNNLIDIEEKILNENDNYISFISNDALFLSIANEIIEFDKKIIFKNENYDGFLNDIIFNYTLIKNLLLFIIIGGKYLFIYDKKNNKIISNFLFLEFGDDNIIFIRKMLKSQEIKNFDLLPNYNLFLNLQYNFHKKYFNKKSMILLKMINMIYNTSPLFNFKNFINLNYGNIYIKNNFKNNVNEIYGKIYLIANSLIKISEFMDIPNSEESTINIINASKNIINKKNANLYKNKKIEMQYLISDLKSRCLICVSTFNYYNINLICEECMEVIARDLFYDTDIYEILSKIKI